MSDIVLVHGAWQGAWCWARVVPLLEAAGRVVATPTLTGSGERAGELTPEVDLQRHTDDVVAELVERDRSDVVLVGHSYSGMVVSGVAERTPERLAALVFVDAFYPGDGDSALDQMPAPFQQLFRQRAAEEGDGWRLPANDGLLDVWGLHDPQLRDWVRPQLTDWSLNCFTSPLPGAGAQRSKLPRTYVSARGEGYPARDVFAAIAERAGGDGCDVVPVDTGHDVMVEDPDSLAEVILRQPVERGG